MKPFIDDNFLLQSSTAQMLYHTYAVKMPVIDYHNHLLPQQVAADNAFSNISEAWLHGDHYKWRAMRSNGVDEKYITGNATDIDKFRKWAETVPYTLRNPLYHWTHLELKRYFGIGELLNPDTADKIYAQTSEMLPTNEFSTHRLLQKMNVEVICTTDDPLDTLEYHIQHAKSRPDTKMLPTWRPDKAIAIENPDTYNKYINKLSEVVNADIKTFDDLMQALKKRHDFFDANGCKLSDHGLEYFFADDYTQHEVNHLFSKIRAGNNLTPSEVLKLKSAMLHELAVLNHEKAWTQQYHFGAIRNNNSRLFKSIGADIGCDSIGDAKNAKAMAKFLDSLDKKDKLTKTIIYNLNPADNEMVATMIGNFQDSTIAGKIQFGSGWWFLDQKEGIEKQINALSALGLLSRFVGMLTDSRSFLSFPRHEYFRRVLCNLLGDDIENGLIPNDINLVGSMIENICYNNAKQYFGFTE